LFKPNVKQKDAPLLVAHIVQVKKYGLNTYEHATTLCCNTLRRDYTTKSWRKKEVG